MRLYHGPYDARYKRRKEVVHLSDVIVGVPIVHTPVIIQRIVIVRAAAAAVAGASLENV